MIYFIVLLLNVLILAGTYKLTKKKQAKTYQAIDGKFKGERYDLDTWRKLAISQTSDKTVKIQLKAAEDERLFCLLYLLGINLK